MKRIILLLMFLIFCSSLFAQPMREVVFFGDSLSDNGNLYRKVKIIPKSPPYYAGQFSNGSVWAERLRIYLEMNHGISAQNYAVGGATVVYRSARKGSLPYYLQREIDGYLTSNRSTNKDNVLYFFWMGANDYMDEKEKPVDALVTEVVDEIILQVRVLIEQGAKNFVLIDLPNLAKGPFVKNTDQNFKERMAALSLLNHQKMQESVELLKRTYPTFNFLYIDAYSIFNDMLVNMSHYNERYHKHITNMTDACWAGSYNLTNREIDPELQTTIQSSTALSTAYAVGTKYTIMDKACGDPDNFFFWDAVHPTAATHDIFTSLVIEQIGKEFNF